MTRALLYVAGGTITIALLAFTIYRIRSQPALQLGGYSIDLQYKDLKEPARSYSGTMYVRWGTGIRGIRTDYVYADRRRIQLSLGGAAQNWMLDPDHRTYWAIKTWTMLKGRSIPKGGPRLIEVPEGGAFRSLGVRTIAGRETHGFEITGPGPDSRLTWTAWEDDKLGTVLLIDKPGIQHTEATRVDQTVPAEDLFRIPEGYTKIEAPPS